MTIAATVAMVAIMATVDVIMNILDQPTRPFEAEAIVASWLEKHGWLSERMSSDAASADLVVSDGNERLIGEVKSFSEGRADRVIPLLSQAILQAQSYVRGGSREKPLAVVYVNRASPQLYDNVLEFASMFAPEVAVAVVSGQGLGVLKRGGSQSLAIDDREMILLQSRNRHDKNSATQSYNPFSDLNQWMLKVLLASDIEDELLNAPRSRYRSGAELAASAKVSEMSASRFLHHLRQDGFLDESTGYMRLVRREELLANWRSAARKRPVELPMRVLLRSAVRERISRVLQADDGKACLGLFAAADAMKLGHVSGVPPYIYVAQFPNFAGGDHRWDMMKPSSDDAPDFILRRAAAPESTFRGALRRDGSVFADVLQVWLDVSNHPTRGQEQADLIYRHVLQPLINAKN